MLGKVFIVKILLMVVFFASYVQAEEYSAYDGSVRSGDKDGEIYVWNDYYGYVKYTQDQGYYAVPGKGHYYQNREGSVTRYPAVNDSNDRQNNEEKEISEVKSEEYPMYFDD